MNEIEFKLILDSLAEGVCTIDKNWNIISFNRAAEKLTGLKAKEILNKPASMVFDPEHCQCSEFLKKTMSAGEKFVDKKSRIMCSKTGCIPVKLNTTPMYDNSGDIIGVVMAFRDISDVEMLRRELKHDFCCSDIISKNSRMKQIFDILPHIAESRSSVLILGESGTGKELFARAIHNMSNHSEHPFIAVNCGALPDNLLESELFGYCKGAFTDAVKDKPGRFELAGNGTLFLDEIGDISHAMQVKLLRVLQEKVFEPLGSTSSIKTNARIIAATNRDLITMMEKGDFRSDLYYRLNVVQIDIPPLRERKEDIPLLIEHFIEKQNAIAGKEIHSISEEALRELIKYDFPGNIRELENIVERAYVMCPFTEIQKGCLPKMLDATPKSTRPLIPATTNTIDQRYKTVSEEEEKEIIIRELHKNNFHRQRTAMNLGINPSTLWRKMKKYEIQ